MATAADEESEASSPRAATLERRAKRHQGPAQARKAALKHLPQARASRAGRRPRPPQARRARPSAAPPAAGWSRPRPGPVTAGRPGAPPRPPPVPPPRSTRRSPSPHAAPSAARQAERLLWRAGFGPRPGQAAQRRRAWASTAAVPRSPAPPATRRWTAPRRRSTASRSTRYATWGHDHLWWLDRMVRSASRSSSGMALVFHDWFARRHDARRLNATLMLEQNDAVPRPRRSARSPTCSRAVTRDPAMLVFLNGIDNRKGATERELRARGDGAVHARRRPRRLHGDRRARAGARADRLARRLDRRHRLGELPLRRATAGTPAPRRSSASPAPSTWQDAVRPRASRTRCTRRSSCASCGRYFVPVPPGADDAGRARAPLRRLAATRSARSSRRSSARPQLYDGPARWSSRRSSSTPACCGRPARRSPTTPGRGSRPAPASACSTRPTSSGWDDDPLDGHEHPARPLGRSSTRRSRPRRHLARRGAPTRPRPPRRPSPRARAFWNDPPLTRRDASPSLTHLRRDRASPASAERRAARASARTRCGMLIGDLPRPPDLLMPRPPALHRVLPRRSCCAAPPPAPAAACPPIEPGMPDARRHRPDRAAPSCRAPAGSRWPSTAAALLRPGAFEDGIAAAAGRAGPRARVRLPGRRHGRADAAGAGRRRRATRSCARRSRSRTRQRARRVHRGPDAAVAPGRRAAARPARARARSP